MFGDVKTGQVIRTLKYADDLSEGKPLLQRR
jgi:hypothetical protein